jgi:hypothetical protein
MNLFVLFGDGAIAKKKNYTTLSAMMQFPVTFFSGDGPSPNKKKLTLFLKSLKLAVALNTTF